MVSFIDTENKLIGSLLQSPLESNSIHQIAQETGLSYVTVHTIVPKLFRENIIKVEKKGKAHLVSINLEYCPIEKIASALLYQRIIFLKKHPSFVLFLRDLEEALANMFYCLLLFGSYAKGSEKGNSDIDLLFIVANGSTIEEYKRKISSILKLYPTPRKEYTIVSTKTFLEMLDQKYTQGREVLTHSLVLFGAEYYYSMVKSYVRTKGY